MTSLIKHEDPNDMKVFKELCKTCIASGKYGADMNEATMLNIMLTARDLGISPMKAINGGFYIVNGKISMSTTLMIDRIRNSGHSISILEWTKDKCVIVGKRKDTGDTCKLEYTLEDAQVAGLLNSPTWKKHPKSMLSARAHSMLARVLFPDVVGNAYSEDEGHEIQNIPPSRRPDVDPDAITIDMETGEYPAQLVVEYCLEDLHAKVLVGTIDELRDYVRFVSITKSISEQDTIKWIMESEKSMKSFRENLTKRITKDENEEATAE